VPLPEWDDLDDLEAVMDRNEVDDALTDMLLDWADFWANDHGDAEWIAEPVIPRGRSTAMFAPGGTGKSLLSLYIATSVAVGRPIFGRKIDPCSVLYLDYEMTADDLAERLGNMGYGPDSDLARLHYALLPGLPGLDQPEGGKAVLRMAEIVDAQLVVIDTFGRAVHGDENEADTVRSWYRNTGLHLKHAGRAFLRVDHAGKDVEKGQRGTSAKNDDVDVVWQMVAGDGGTYTLKAKKRRMSWVPEKVELVMREDDVLEFSLLHGDAWPAGTADCAKTLEALGVGPEVPVRTAMQALKDAGKGKRQDVVRHAQRYRKEQLLRVLQPVDNVGDKVPDRVSRQVGHADPETSADTRRDTRPPETVKPLQDRVSRDLRTRADTRPSAACPDRVSLKGTHRTSTPSADPTHNPDDITEELF
jgi:hypothetical protein